MLVCARGGGGVYPVMLKPFPSQKSWGLGERGARHLTQYASRSIAPASLPHALHLSIGDDTSVYLPATEFHSVRAPLRAPGQRH
jgi:hypothetical protein